MNLHRLHKSFPFNGSRRKDFHYHPDTSLLVALSHAETTCINDELRNSFPACTPFRNFFVFKFPSRGRQRSILSFFRINQNYSSIFRIISFHFVLLLLLLLKEKLNQINSFFQVNPSFYTINHSSRRLGFHTRSKFPKNRKWIIKVNNIKMWRCLRLT